MIGIESFGPLILKHWSKTAGVKNPNIFKFLDLFEYVSQFHIIWFYLEETFYQISKRIVDVRYIKLRPWGGLRHDSPMTKWLKLLSLVNGLILMMQLYTVG